MSLQDQSPRSRTSWARARGCTCPLEAGQASTLTWGERSGRPAPERHPPLHLNVAPALCLHRASPSSRLAGARRASLLLPLLLLLTLCCCVHLSGAAPAAADTALTAACGRNATGSVDMGSAAQALTQTLLANPVVARWLQPDARSETSATPSTRTFVLDTLRVTAASILNHVASQQAAQAQPLQPQQVRTLQPTCQGVGRAGGTRPCTYPRSEKDLLADSAANAELCWPWLGAPSSWLH